MIARLAVIGRHDSDFDALIAQAIERAGGRPVDLTVVAIGRPPTAWAFAPLTGRVTPEQLRRDALQAAIEAAQRAVLRLGRDVAARYFAVERPRQLAGRAIALADLDVVAVADEVRRHPCIRWRRRDLPCA